MASTSTDVVGALAGVPQDLHRGDQQDHAEQQEGERQPVERGGAERDEDAAQHQRADDAVEQHPLLQRHRHREGGQQQHEDEQVVDRQRLLDQVAGVVLDAGRGAEAGPDVAPKASGQGDVEDRPADRLPHRDLVRLAGDGEVEHQQRDDRADRGGPQAGRADRLDRCGLGEQGRCHAGVSTESASEVSFTRTRATARGRRGTTVLTGRCLGSTPLNDRR
jgi:hypothetical protein